LDDWPSSARLPKELDAAGLAVVAMCGSASPLRLTRYAAHVSVVTANTIASELARLIVEYEPVGIIASDEISVRQLHRFARDPRASEPMRTLLRRSLGDPSGYSIVTSKSATANLAKELNITVPRQSQVHSIEEAMSFARDGGFPVILKRENTYGGIGSVVCTTQYQLINGYQGLVAPSWLRRGFRAVARRNTLARLKELSKEPILIQEFHEGQLVFSAAVADEGTMVAGLTALAEVVFPAPTGSSAVIRAVDAPELLEISRALIAATRCSGFIGVDFIIARKSRRVYLLEINPRVTPLCHLGRPFGTDLCAAYAARFAKIVPIPPACPQAKVEAVALFPNEWMRDSTSPFLTAAHHDVPIDEPGLIADAYLRLPMRKRLTVRMGLHARFWPQGGTLRSGRLQPL
jgi:glutathione synthase/RimK-type ligase-like ATP-grasp enzyme